jgi:hypothetical protein
MENRTEEEELKAWFAKRGVIVIEPRDTISIENSDSFKRKRERVLETLKGAGLPKFPISDHKD